MQRTPEEILDMNIETLVATFEWPSQTRTQLRCLTCNINWEYFGLGKIEDHELETKIKLAHVLKLLEEKYEEWPSRHFVVKHNFLIKKLEAIGLTALDSIVISPKTVTIEMLKRLPKEELLKKDARVLGTLSNIAVRWYRYWDGKDSPSPTVAEFFAKGPTEFMSKKMKDATKKVIIDLGLQEEGKKFFRDTKKAFVEELMESESLSEKIATIVANVAEKRGWKKFQE